MSYPLTPTDGQTYGNKKYNSTKGLWTDYDSGSSIVGSVYTQYAGTQDPATLFGGTWTDISASIPQAAKGGIYESGSNANGSYVKYADGTMECWWESPTIVNCNAGVLGATRYSAAISNIQFPQPFISIPLVSGLNERTNNFISTQFFQLSATQIGSLTLCDMGSGIAEDTAQGVPGYHAIGKWSNTAYSPSTFWQKTDNSGATPGTPTLIQSSIYDSGSNVNGSWVRYTDGTMQVWKNITFTNLALTNVQGGMYYSTVQNLGPWPIAFIGDPTATCTIKSTYDIWATCTLAQGPTATNAGNWYPWTNTSRPSETVTFMVQALGKWSAQTVPAPQGGIMMSGIYDSGSNANGSWIRYSDGTMQVWFNVTTSIGSATGLPSPILYEGSYTWTFPQSFISLPSISSPTINAPSAHTVSGRIWGTPSTTSAIIGGYASVAANYPITVSAIGKWSNTAVQATTSFPEATLSPTVQDLTILGDVTKKLVRVNARGNSGQAFPGDGVARVVIFPAENEDTHGCYNPTTGVFTAQKDGLYMVSAGVLVNWGGNVASDCAAELVAGTETITNYFSVATAQSYVHFNVSGVIRRTVGQTIEFRIMQNSSVAKSIFNAPTNSYHYLNITQLLGT